VTVSEVRPLTLNAWLRWDVVRRRLGALSPAPTRILELGAGQGGFATRLAQLADYVGVEPDDRSRQVCQAGLGAGRAQVHASLDDVPAGTGFDLLCSFEVLEHIDDDHGQLATWVTRLVPGSNVIVSVPAYRRRFGPSDERVGHVRRYDHDDLVQLLEGAGLVDVDVRVYGFPLGYVLDAARNLIARRRPSSESTADRTAQSGRMFQPSRRAAWLTRVATAPFRLAQRPLERTAVGTGFVATARTPSARARDT
jgi:SAM-dependent methyltransferase